MDKILAKEKLQLPLSPEEQAMLYMYKKSLGIKQ